MASAETNPHVISGFMSSSAMTLAMKAATRDQALAELVDQVPDAQDDPTCRDRLLAALKEREELHSTGIGDGIALPHSRNALGSLVRSPVIVFGRHAAGLEFGSLDGRPVHLLFLLVTTSVTQHLQILARISRLLRSADLRSELTLASTPEDVLAAVRRAEGA